MTADLQDGRTLRATATDHRRSTADASRPAAVSSAGQRRLGRVAELTPDAARLRHPLRGELLQLVDDAEAVTNPGQTLARFPARRARFFGSAMTT